MAFYLRSGGGIRYLNAFEGGAQQDRIDGGAHQLCAALAARLGDRVRLGQPVRAVHQDGGPRQRRQPRRGHSTPTRSSSRCRRCWPTRIDFQPALPARRASAATAPGCAVKVHLVYPAPLWREHGLSGWSVNADGPLLSTVDDSPPDGSVGVLTGFVTGARGAPLRRAHRRPSSARRPSPRRRGCSRSCRRRSATTSPTGSTRSTAAAATPRCSAPATGSATARADSPARPRALGRHRDQHGVLRAHGGRDPLGPSCGGRNPGPPRPPSGQLARPVRRHPGRLSAPVRPRSRRDLFGSNTLTLIEGLARGTAQYF